MKPVISIDMKPLTTALKNISNNVDEDTLGKATLAGLFVLEGHAKLNVRKNFTQRTGFLASAWETKLDKVSKHNAEGHTSPLAVYARIQELGGVIRATSAAALHFQTPDGAWHSVQAVTIPARPYLRPAADENQKDIFKTVGIVLEEAITRK